MHRLLVRILQLAALVALTDTAPLPAQESADLRFLRLEQAWMDALAAQDTVHLQRTLAVEFTILGAGSTADQAVGTRAEWLANAARFQWPRHTVRLLGVRPLGKATVVQAVLTATYPPRSITPEGGEITFLVTDTWVERAGRWQAVARHASLASPVP